MNDIIALTQEAHRRTQRAECMTCGGMRHISERRNLFEISGDEKELLLLVAVIIVLISSGANFMVLLAIMYVIL